MRGSCKGEELCQWWKNGDVNIEIGQLNDKRLLDSGFSQRQKAINFFSNSAP